MKALPQSITAMERQVLPMPRLSQDGITVPLRTRRCCRLWPTGEARGCRAYLEAPGSLQRHASRLELTFPDEGGDLWVEALPVALPPEAHVGGVVLPAALVRRAHGEQLPAIPGPEEFALPAVQARAARAQRQVVVVVVNETGIDPAGVEGLAPVPVLPGVRLVPVVGADGHSQHAEGAER